MQSISQYTLSTRCILLALLALVGCGESGLESIEDRELDIAERTAINAAGNTPVPDTGAALQGIDLTEYVLVFNDEFNGSELDSNKWNTALPWGSDLIINGEKQYYVDIQKNTAQEFNPFSFDGQSLIISAKATPETLKASSNNQDYLSGAITSAEKFTTTYGYIEANIDFPAGAGLWPSFWMLSSEFVGLKPQLFIAEYNGAKPNSIFHNYNFHDDTGNLRSPGQWQVTEAGISEGFHRVGVSWSQEELLFYIDGMPRYRVIGENISQQPMYLIANLAVGGVWTGSVTDTSVLPAELKIDYIRVYSKSGI